MKWFVLSKYYPFAILHLGRNSYISAIKNYTFYESLLVAQFNQSEALFEYFTTKGKHRKAQKHLDKCQRMKELFPEEFV